MKAPALKSPAQRRKRAMIATVILAAALVLPIVALRGLDQRRTAVASELGPVPEFLLRDVDGEHVSRSDLEGSLTVAATLGGACSDPTVAACVTALVRINEIGAYAAERLLYANKTETSPLALLVVSDAVVPVALPWRRIETSASDEAGVFLAPSAVAPSVSVVDQAGSIIFSRALGQESLLPVLKPLLSKLTINHYMRDYLAKRTFFRREPKGDATN